MAKMQRLLFFMGLLATLLMDSLAVQGLSSDEKEFIVKSHNKERKRTRPDAANMRIMGWDSILEGIAREWVSNCEYTSLPAEKDIGANYFYKENARPGEMSQDEFVRAAVRRWTNRKKRFIYATDCGLACSYVKMIFALTDKIGCAINSCPSVSSTESMTPYLVCIYSTPQVNGNLPYQKGPHCSQCPEGWNCTDGLCFDVNDKSNGFSTDDQEGNANWQNQPPWQSQAYLQGPVHTFNESGRNGTRQGRPRSLDQLSAQGQNEGSDQITSEDQDDLNGLKHRPAGSEIILSSQKETGASSQLNDNNQPPSLSENHLQNQPTSVSRAENPNHFYRQNQWGGQIQNPGLYQPDFQSQQRGQYGSDFQNRFTGPYQPDFPNQFTGPYQPNIQNRFSGLYHPNSPYQISESSQPDLQNHLPRQYLSSPQNQFMGPYQRNLQTQLSEQYQTDLQERATGQSQPNLQNNLSNEKKANLHNQQPIQQQPSVPKNPTQGKEKLNLQNRRTWPSRRRIVMEQYPSGCQSQFSGQSSYNLQTQFPGQYPYDFQTQLLEQYSYNLQNQPIEQFPFNWQGQSARFYPLPTQGQFKGQYGLPTQGQFKGQQISTAQGQHKGQYPIPTQGQFKGQRPLTIQGELKTQYPLPAQGHFKGQRLEPLQVQVKGKNSSPTLSLLKEQYPTFQGQFKGQYPPAAQGQFKGQYPLSAQGQFKGQYPLPVQGQFKGQYPLPAQGQFKGQYPLPAQGQFKGQYPLHVQGQFKGQYPLPDQGQFKGQYPLPDQDQLKSQYPILTKGQFKGQNTVPIKVPLKGKNPSLVQGQYKGMFPLSVQKPLKGLFPIQQGQVYGLYPFSIETQFQGQYPLLMQNQFQGFYPVVPQNQFTGQYPFTQQNQMAFLTPCQSNYQSYLINKGNMAPFPNYPVQFPQVSPAKGKTIRPGTLVDNDMQNLLDVHNNIRMQVGQRQLVWDPYLEYWSNYVIRCSANFPGQSNAYTNFASIPMNYPLYAAVDEWRMEEYAPSRPSQTCRTPYNRQLCTPFSNIIQPDLTHMGCAAMMCYNYRKVVCIYDTMEGREKFFIVTRKRKERPFKQQ